MCVNRHERFSSHLNRKENDFDEMSRNFFCCSGQKLSMGLCVYCLPKCLSFSFFLRYVVYMRVLATVCQILLFFFFFVVMGIKPRTLCTPGKYFTTELHSKSFLAFFQLLVKLPVWLLKFSPSLFSSVRWGGLECGVCSTLRVGLVEHCERKSCRWSSWRLGLGLGGLQSVPWMAISLKILTQCTSKAQQLQVHIGRMCPKNLPWVPLMQWRSQSFTLSVTSRPYLSWTLGFGPQTQSIPPLPFQILILVLPSQPFLQPAGFKKKGSWVGFHDSYCPV